MDRWERPNQGAQGMKERFVKSTARIARSVAPRFVHRHLRRGLAGDVTSGESRGSGVRFSRLGLAVLFAAIATMVLGASAAQAEPFYPYIGSFGPQGSEDGQFNPPGRVAVDASGDVFVIDQGATPRVEV